MGLIIVPIIVLSRRAPAEAQLAGGAAVVDAARDREEETTSVDGGPQPPAVWRVSNLGNEGSLEVTEGTVGKRPIANALAASGLAKNEAHRVITAFERVHKLEKCTPKDKFTIAKEKASGHVVAFELESSPLDVWQAIVPGVDAEGTHSEPPETLSAALEVRKVDLHVERKRVEVAISVGDDLRADVVKAGLDDDIVKLLADALEGHAEVSSLRKGSRLRIVATEDEVEGEFGRYVALDAVEYFPPRPNAPSLRVYFYSRSGVPETYDEDVESKRKRRHGGSGGYYDVKGRQPFHGGWRLPVPFAKVTSRFNPKRMHPVLHTIMPHNGVDFGATTGTPIYATAPGIVRSVGDGGACGNMVQLLHSNGLVSAYCHMSRFAAGLHPGQKVEGRQLLGYVGATGRVTGPHLHFAVKRGDVFLDPLTLNLDGMRVLPHADRQRFAKRREELNAALEAIPLPQADFSDEGRDGGDGEAEVFEEPP